MKNFNQKPKYYRFRLANDSAKYRCPNCGHHTFVLYMDYEMGGPLDPKRETGRCDREDKCGYHYPPRTFFMDNRGFKVRTEPRITALDRFLDAAERQQRNTYISEGVMLGTFWNYDQNNFAVFFRNQVGHESADELLRLYNVGTSEHWKGATIFWQKDRGGNVRTGTVMPYSPQTGKRLKGKNGQSYINWVHTQFKLPPGNYNPCFFGEHLLPLYPDKTVAVVESEKTALIMAHYMPEYLWLACSGSNGLTDHKFEALRFRQVLLVPDDGQYEKWLAKSRQFYQVCVIKVSQRLQQIKQQHPDLEDGFDIADVALKGQKIYTLNP